MITRFAKLYEFISRSPGTYVNGVWSPGTETSSMRLLDIQPMTNTTSQMLQALPEGRRTMETRIVYSNFEDAVFLPNPSNGTPGDLVKIGGDRWLFVSSAAFSSIGGVTTHGAYLIQREIEKGPGESPT